MTVDLAAAGARVESSWRWDSTATMEGGYNGRAPQIGAMNEIWI